MPFRTRSYWLTVGLLAYVCLGALPGSGRPLVPLGGLLLLSIWLGEVWRRTARREAGERHIEAAAHTALRICHAGAALWVAARLGAPGRAAYDAIANAGVGTAAVATLVTLARLPAEKGLLVPAPATRSLDAAAFAGLLWGIAVALPGARALFPRIVVTEPLAVDYATTTASIGTLLVLVSASLRLRVQRRLEMGIRDRIEGAFVLSLTACFVTLPAALFDIAPPDRILPIGVLVASLACAWTATVPEATTVSVAQRGVLAVMLLGVPAALFVAIAARAMPQHAAPITLIGSVIAIAVGLVARDVARPLGPEQSRWLVAIEQASRGALQPEPDAAIRAALEALRDAARTPDTRPELFRSSPEEVMSVDVAGYLHVEKAQVPESLYTLADGEPERTLRVDVLRTLEVRRPDVRPLLAWFEARRAFSATLVVDEEGPIGVLLLPRGARTKPMTLEEARAIRLLCDRISALLAVSSALARSRAREIEASLLATEEGRERGRLEKILASTTTRQRAFAEVVARPALIAAHSPAARFAQDEIARLAGPGGPVVLVTPPGVDAISFAAAAHLSSPRSGGPLVVADAATAATQDSAGWETPELSPLGLADGGTLVVLDLPALPAAVQDLLAQHLGTQTSQATEGRVPPAGLVFTVREPIATLISEGRLTERLAAHLEDQTITLPPLASRSEDLRSLVLDHLARTGVQMRGQPLGVEARALALLLEHPWPGNDTELRDVLVRAAGVATGPLVTSTDLLSVGFGAPASGQVPARPTTIPPPSAPPETRRRRARPSRNPRES